MRIYILMITCLTLISCAPSMQYVWEPLPHAKIELHQAKAECDYEADKARPNWRSSLVAISEHSDLYKKCLKAKGFYLKDVTPVDKIKVPTY